MKKVRRVAAALLLTAMGIAPAEAAFVVGGENGWQLSTDGIVDVFSVYQSTSPLPAAGAGRFTSFLSGSNDYYQNFGVTVGLLPSVVAFNVKAPTVNGIDSSVRIGIYPSIQNRNHNTRFETNPNIDFREIFYTAKGNFGEFLAGRALNLYQGKNILTDMTLLTAGVVPAPGTTTTLGHIGYGYLYTNFGPQIRYTTPNMSGVKVAFSINEPYNISSDTAKTNFPRLETEISYAGAMGDTSVQAWASGLYQEATRSTAAAARPGSKNRSIGGAAGVGVGFKGIDLLTSGYLGEGLGMISAQDGDAFGSSSTDAAGEERTHFGFLAQATYQVNPDWKVGVNYGQNRQLESDYDKTQRGTYGTTGFVPMRKQEAAVAMVTYNLNKFTQFIAEYSYAQNTWQDRATQHSNSFAVGTLFYW